MFNAVPVVRPSAEIFTTPSPAELPGVVAASATIASAEPAPVRIPELVNTIALPVVVDVVTSIATAAVVAPAIATYNAVPVVTPVGVIATKLDAPVPVKVPEPFTIKALFARSELSVIEKTSEVLDEVRAKLPSEMVTSPAVRVNAAVPTASPVMVVAPSSDTRNCVAPAVES